MDLRFEPRAASDLDHLWTISPVMYNRVNDWLDKIEDNPGDPSVRRNRLTRPAMWLIRVYAPDGDDYVILWELDGEQPVIKHVGPDVFR